MVLEVEDVVRCIDGVGEVFDHLRDMVECIGEHLRVRRVAVAEAWKVRGDEMKPRRVTMRAPAAKQGSTTSAVMVSVCAASAPPPPEALLSVGVSVIVSLCSPGIELSSVAAIAACKPPAA